MMIKSYRNLTSRGNAKGRRIVIGIMESALQQVNSYDLVKQRVKVGKVLKIGPFRYDLKKIRNIFVVGGGKQVTFVASALEDILGERIREGVVVEKKGWGRKTKKIRVIAGGHPIPDAGSVEGGKEILRVARMAGKDDLVIACVTGGCTSLTLLPLPGITLNDARKISKLLLYSGAPLEAMNTVRKHLSQVGGGRLAMASHPAKVVSLIALDEIEGLPWGPTVPDTTTFLDAKHVLMRYDLWHKAPKSVRRCFESADKRLESPKARDFAKSGVKSRPLIFADNRMLCQAAKRKATELGIGASIISTAIEGEAKDVGVALANLAREIESNGRPFKAPHILIAGGETTVKIDGAHGEGGRNQELALAAALKIAGNTRITIGSIATDGTDGPTDIAGAIVDGYTLRNSRQAGIDPIDSLKRHNTSNAFRRLGDAIYAGNTATNLMDLMIAYAS